MVCRTPWFPAYPAQRENPAWCAIKTWLIVTRSDRASNADPRGFSHDPGFSSKGLADRRFVRWCREGGSNPHDRKDRRILSPFLGVLHDIAL